MNVGIDALTFYIPPFAIPLAILAEGRGIDPQKYLKGLGQQAMAVTSPDEDVVTLAANAALQLKKRGLLDHIDLFLFATESAFDASKGAGLFVHGLLKLPQACRVIELKQACYSGIFGLQTAVNFIRSGQARKVLLIAADIARYELDSPAESSQGAAAVAMIISENPKILAIEPQSSFIAVDEMDFFRPCYRQEAIVDGHYSCSLYLSLLKKTWQDFLIKTRLTANDFSGLCFHTPVPRLVRKAYGQLELDPEDFDCQESLLYSEQIGNSYTASIFLSLCSLLEHSKRNYENKLIGFYSYGSGAVAEFFSGRVVEAYKEHLFFEEHIEQFKNRKLLTLEHYEYFYNAKLPEDGSDLVLPSYVSEGFIRLKSLSNHRRLYDYASVQQSVVLEHA